VPDPHPDRLAGLESAYLAARDARDRLDIAHATGVPADVRDLEREALETGRAAREALRALDGERMAGSGEDDARALVLMRGWIEEGSAAAAEPGVGELGRRLGDDFGTIAAALPVGGGTLSRVRILGRLATEPDDDSRRRLFLALEPLWHAVDGDGGPASPYRALVRESAGSWAAGRSPIAANETALGLAPGTVEAWARATLEAWRDAVVEPARARGEAAIEPWDWWWRAGEADRALAGSLRPERVFEVNRRVYATLGADLEALGVRLDTTPRPGRPPVPVATTEFGGRPHRRPDGTWSPGAPTILASYVDGGLGDLMELVHETGHAIHIGSIRTRPAFADWPDSDALTEALAELVALDVSEPAWQDRWLSGALGTAPPVSAAHRCRYAAVVLDAAWALFEIRLHADPGRRPNDVWTELTAGELGIAPHPEWSWWAIRGQLVADPGYMANYAIGAVLAADLRAAIRAARGDWTGGDPGWHAWVSERLYRFGLERPSGRVVRDVLGRPPGEDALLREISKARA
jgi:hypothetical protein